MIMEIILLFGGVILFASIFGLIIGTIMEGIFKDNNFNI